ncbi:lasso peptide biosynthesis PqqD family chaperone [Streptantibioticus ferralitis]|uniref:Lasso peptide biosynthesis PqqD family chaperone n=1 Tax=Streptantibioticus ferralitis TaxID=236510 RepID=A0ABT5YVT1_9ACTN|nr:lasso peptide biosynthesis PqqD family chaperone [Streptantibioticus ferralitis]MDF2255583.1 lasso peptide biosynthesis PqqD family chaperone [Streptantibioticus ferralitis]
MSRLRSDVTACPTDDGMVLLDERRGCYWQLNGTGALVVQALLDGATPQQVADQLARTRPVSQERAAADVAALVDQLTRAKLVTAP